MSIQFSDTTNKTGLVETLARYTGTQTATTSTYTLAQKTLDINNAYAHFFRIANEAAGNWQADDTAQSGVPVTTFNLVSGTGTYAFTVDSSSNQILDIYKIRIKDTNGNWIETIYQIDKNTDDISQYQNITGVPVCYDLTGNNITFYPTPSYNSTNGAELSHSRTPIYFTTSDTTKKPGIPDYFHEYLAIRPAYFFCFTKGLLKQASELKDQMLTMEAQIRKYYSDRNKTDQLVITTEDVCSI